MRRIAMVGTLAGALVACPGGTDGTGTDTGTNTGTNTGTGTGTGTPPTPAAAPYFAFLAAQQHPERGLLASFVPHDELPVAFGDYLARQNPSFTYDDALAALAWLGRGQPGDADRATSVLDGLLAVQYADGAVPDVVNLGTGAATGRSTGNLAWVMLAWLEGHRQLGHERWLLAAERAAAFLLDPAQALQNDVGFGGFRLTPGSTIVSTEHALDLFPALSQLADRLPTTAGLLTVDEVEVAALHTRIFAESRVDPATGAVFTGTGADGATTFRDVVPTDTHTWSVLALGRPRWVRSLVWVTDVAAGGSGALWVESPSCPSQVGSIAIAGPAYSTADVSDVWFEGLAQVHAAALLAGDASLGGRAWAALDAARQRAPNTDEQGLVATCSEIATGFGSSYFNALAVGPTAWAALAATDTNPYWPAPLSDGFAGHPAGGLPTVSLSVPAGARFTCDDAVRPCTFTVTGTSTGVAGTGGRALHVLVQPTDPAVPAWFTQVAATVAPDGSWSAEAQLGSAESGGDDGDALTGVAVVVEGAAPGAVLDAVTPATVPGLVTVSGLLEATVRVAP